MLYEYLEQLCKERGMSISKLLGEIGISKSAASRWKSKGYEPSNATKKRIADFFGISVQELEAGQKEKPADQMVDELTEDEKLMLDLFNSLSPENQELALAQADFLLRRQEKK